MPSQNSQKKGAEKISNHFRGRLTDVTYSYPALNQMDLLVHLYKQECVAYNEQCFDLFKCADNTPII